MQLPPIRLAEFVGALSLATDLSVGCPMETALRCSLLAVRLGAELGCSGPALSDVYYATLLRLLGCTGAAHEEAWRFGGGDDIAMRQAFMRTDLGDVGEVIGTAVKELGRGSGLLSRVRATARFLRPEGGGAGLPQIHCEQAMTLAGDLQMGAGVVRALAEMYERFDGRGLPEQRRGSELSLTARLMHVAFVAEMERIAGGPAAAVQEVRRRSGGQLDPDLAAAFAKRALDLMSGLDAASVWESFLASEPAPYRTVSPADLDRFARAFGCFADVKSPYTLGHSTGVAELAGRAAAELGLPAPEQRHLRLAALLHDLGSVSVPNGIWDRPGPLNPIEWERVRLHPYQSERILSQAASLRPAALLVGRHHERLDGSGYHRGLSGELGTAVDLLAASDAYQGMLQERAYRPPLSREGAASVLREEASLRHLDRAAVEAVLKAAGHRAARASQATPAGLSPREVEVLRLLARGLADKEIAQRLSLSPRTVHHHVQHIYEKTGVSSRAAAALYAVRHELVAAE